MKTDGGKPLARVPEMALQAGLLSPRVLYAWIASGVVPQEILIRSGRAIFIRRPLFLRWLAGNDGAAIGSNGTEGKQ